MRIFENIGFASPILLGGIFLFFLILWMKRKKTKNNFFSFPLQAQKVYAKNSWWGYASSGILFLVGILFFVFFAGPYREHAQQNETKNGIDIAFVLDVSMSMEAQDLSPNRMEASKNFIQAFLKNEKTDRVGLVFFAGKPFVSIPFTFDYEILKESIQNISTQSVNQQNLYLNGTAIGDALLMAQTLFQPSLGQSKQEYEKRKKVVILLTDGEANKGIDPKIAVKSLAKQGIIVYTIGIGSKQGGVISFPIAGGIHTEKIPPLDDNKLSVLAQMTGGEYFRAEDNESFTQIVHKLSTLQKNDITVKKYTFFTWYYGYVMGAICVLVCLYFILMAYRPRFYQ